QTRKTGAVDYFRAVASTAYANDTPRDTFHSGSTRCVPRHERSSNRQTVIRPRCWVRNEPTMTANEDRKWETEALDPRARLVWLGQEIVAGVVVGLVGTWILDKFLFALDGWVGPAAAVVLALVGVAYALVRHRVGRCGVQGAAIYFGHGLFTLASSEVPFVRIPYVAPAEGPVH